MVIHQVGAVVLKLSIVAIRCQRLVDKNQACVGAAGDAALSSGLAPRPARLAIAGIDHVRDQQVAGPKQVVPDLIHVEAVGRAIGVALASDELKTSSQLAKTRTGVIHVPGQIRRDIGIVVYQFVVTPNDRAGLQHETPKK